MSGSYFDPLSGYPQIEIFVFFSPNGQRETKIDLKGFATVQSMYGNGSTRECSARIKFHDEISRLLFTLTQISHEFHDVYFTTVYSSSELSSSVTCLGMSLNLKVSLPSLTVSSNFICLQKRKWHTTLIEVVAVIEFRVAP